MEDKILYRIGVILNSLIKNDPNGSRTRVAAVKGRCPRPLDDGVIYRNCFGAILYSFLRPCQDNSFFQRYFKLKILLKLRYILFFKKLSFKISCFYNKLLPNTQLSVNILNPQYNMFNLCVTKNKYELPYIIGIKVI